MPGTCLDPGPTPGTPPAPALPIAGALACRITGICACDRLEACHCWLAGRRSCWPPTSWCMAADMDAVADARIAPEGLLAGRPPGCSLEPPWARPTAAAAAALFAAAAALLPDRCPFSSMPLAAAAPAGLAGDPACSPTLELLRGCEAAEEGREAAPLGAGGLRGQEPPPGRSPAGAGKPAAVSCASSCATRTLSPAMASSRRHSCCCRCCRCCRRESTWSSLPISLLSPPLVLLPSLVLAGPAELPSVCWDVTVETSRLRCCAPCPCCSCWVAGAATATAAAARLPASGVAAREVAALAARLAGPLVAIWPGSDKCGSRPRSELSDAVLLWLCSGPETSLPALPGCPGKAASSAVLAAAAAAAAEAAASCCCCCRTARSTACRALRAAASCCRRASAASLAAARCRRISSSLSASSLRRRSSASCCFRSCSARRSSSCRARSASSASRFARSVSFRFFCRSFFLARFSRSAYGDRGAAGQAEQAGHVGTCWFPPQGPHTARPEAVLKSATAGAAAAYSQSLPRRHHSPSLTLHPQTLSSCPLRSE